MSEEKTGTEGREQIPVAVISKVLGEESKVRVVIVQHPTRNEPAPCVPYLDYAAAFSYDEESIRKMIQRTPWLQRHSTTSILEGVDGKLRAQLCLFEEGALGLFFKLQPKRCKDPDVSARIDQIQEELILVLRDALRGYKTSQGGYKSEDGFLPRPGLTMDAISTLCKEADKYLKGKTSLRALNYFTGMPIADLLEEMEVEDAEDSPNAGTIVQYLHALLNEDVKEWGIEKETTTDGTVALVGEANRFYNAFLLVGRKEHLPKLFSSATSVGKMFQRETAALELLGWRCVRLPKRSVRAWRLEMMKAQIGEGGV